MPRDSEVCSLLGIYFKINLVMLFENQDIKMIPINEFCVYSSKMNNNIRKTLDAKRKVMNFDINLKNEVIELLDSIIKENPNNYMAISLKG